MKRIDIVFKWTSIAVSWGMLGLLVYKVFFM